MGCQKLSQHPKGWAVVAFDRGQERISSLLLRASENQQRLHGEIFPNVDEIWKKFGQVVTHPRCRAEKKVPEERSVFVVPRSTHQSLGTEPTSAAVLVSQLLGEHQEAIGNAIRAMAYRSGAIRGEEIDDFTSEVVLQVLSQAGKYDASRAIVPWVMGFVGKCLANRKRQLARPQREAPATDVDASWSVFDTLLQAAEDGSNQEEVQYWLDQLNSEDQQILRLRYFEDYDSEAIAQAMKLPSGGAARTRLHRASKRLQEIATGSKGGEA